jgi:hypothetical protein
MGRLIGASAWAADSDSLREPFGRGEVEVVTLGQDREPGVPVMSSIPLDLERRCEQRWAARFSAARALREQHRLERQQQQQLTAPDNSKRKTRRAESAGLRPSPAV